MDRTSMGDGPAVELISDAEINDVLSAWVNLGYLEFGVSDSGEFVFWATDAGSMFFEEDPQ